MEAQAAALARARETGSAPEPVVVPFRSPTIEPLTAGSLSGDEAFLAFDSEEEAPTPPNVVRALQDHARGPQDFRREPQVARFEPAVALPDPQIAVGAARTWTPPWQGWTPPWRTWNSRWNLVGWNWRSIRPRYALMAVGGVAVLSAFWILTAPAPKGWVSITSVPTGSYVKVDGKLSSQTPFGALLPVGEHTIEVQSGTATRSQTINVSRNSEMVLHVELGPATGGLQINAEPPQAQVWIDGTLRG